jgi:hypothetical protein
MRSNIYLNTVGIFALSSPLLLSFLPALTSFLCRFLRLEVFILAIANLAWIVFAYTKAISAINGGIVGVMPAGFQVKDQ